jgi:hypothetical protein
MQVTVETVMGYLYNQIGEGRIRRSDILFAIDAETRSATEQLKREKTEWPRWEFWREVQQRYPAVHPDDAWIYFGLNNPEVYLSDMYAWLYILERFFHTYIRITLEKGHGAEWWRKGIPENIRAECAAALERDPEPAAEPYCYTNFVHLKEIIEKRWDIFSKLLPTGPASDRKRFLAGLNRLNLIRNRVMHAAKGVAPSEQDFRYLREFADFADVLHWI